MKRIKLKRKEEIKFSSRVKQISAHKISLSHTVSDTDTMPWPGAGCLLSLSLSLALKIIETLFNQE